MSSQLSEQLYVALGNHKKVDSILLAFTTPDNAQEIIIQGYTFSWSQQAFEALSNIQKMAHNIKDRTFKNLPYKSLRGMLEVNFEHLERLEPKLGLNHDCSSRPFAYLTKISEQAVSKRLRSVLDLWLTKYLSPFIKTNDLSQEKLDYLEALWEEDKLIIISSFKSQVLPWSWNTHTGTTKPENRNAYVALVDYVAHHIAGHEVFAKLGGLRRIIHSSGGMASSQSELITYPVDIRDEGKFSFVLKLEIVTIPSLHQPLIKIDVSKRRWLDSLKNPSGFNRNDINGYIFSKNDSKRVVGFKVVAHKDRNKKYSWQTDKDFEVVRHHFQLPMQIFNGQDIVSGQANIDGYECLLTYRNGLANNLHEIKAGVPEIDKLEAFEAITQLLQPLGLQPFQNYTPVKGKIGADKSISRMIKLPTLMRSILEGDDSNSSPELERVILDGTERPIQRSKDKEKQKQDYSGKKKRHTRSHLGAIAPDKHILIFTEAYPGKRHDKGILNDEDWVQYIPDEVKIQGDLGFFGLQNEYVNVEIPHKKPKGVDLTDEQKEENRALASERVVCEHAFGGLKRYRIAAEVYRNRKEGFDDRSMLTAAGLWNFYLMAA